MAACDILCRVYFRQWSFMRETVCFHILSARISYLRNGTISVELLDMYESQCVTTTTTTTTIKSFLEVAMTTLGCTKNLTNYLFILTSSLDSRLDSRILYMFASVMICKDDCNHYT